MLLVAGTKDYNTILLTRRGLKAVTREIESKDIEDHRRLAGDSQAPRRRGLKVER